MFTSQRGYRDRLQAVILDWSGTTVDYGCVAPAKVLVAVFAEQGVDITLSEARAPMGTFKRDYIRWPQGKNRKMRQANLKKLYAHGSDYQRYESFQECSSYATMARHHPLNPQLMQWGRHIFFQQAVDGSIIIGDSEVLP